MVLVSTLQQELWRSGCTYRDPGAYRSSEGWAPGPNSAGPHTSRLKTFPFCTLSSDATRSPTKATSRHRMMTVRRRNKAFVGRYTLGGHLVSRHLILVGTSCTAVALVPLPA
jgi:hypothetical protein